MTPCSYACPAAFFFGLNHDGEDMECWIMLLSRVTRTMASAERSRAPHHLNVEIFGIYQSASHSLTHLRNRNIYCDMQVDFFFLPAICESGSHFPAKWNIFIQIWTLKATFQQRRKIHYLLALGKTCEDVSAQQTRMWRLTFSSTILLLCFSVWLFCHIILKLHVTPTSHWWH